MRDCVTGIDDNDPSRGKAIVVVGTAAEVMATMVDTSIEVMKGIAIMQDEQLH